MEKDCIHEIDIDIKSIFSIKPIYNKIFICLNCNKKIKMKVRKVLIRFAEHLINMLFLLVCMFFSEIKFPNINIFLRYAIIFVIFIGFIFIMNWVSNYFIWLFRNKLKYIEIEENDLS